VINKKVGKKIKRIRSDMDMTQEDLAEKVGLHVTSIGRIERGEANPPVSTLEKIARALKVHISELFE
jgi:transcriptional regulator with XRE-family HTH domain